MINKRIFYLVAVSVFCLLMTACGPSEEKVAEAQQKYTDLIKKHNQVVEAHGNVSDGSYDEQLLSLREKITEVEAYNLNDMEDEEIDLLIQIMDTLITSYDEYEAALVQVKEQEEAAVIVTIPVTIVNNTGKAISVLKLYEQGSEDSQVNVLENLTPLEAGQTLLGMMVRRDVENTPWILYVDCGQVSEETDDAGSTDTESVKKEIILPVEEYEESGIELVLVYDEETQTITLASKEPEEDSNKDAENEADSAQASEKNQ